MCEPYIKAVEFTPSIDLTIGISQKKFGLHHLKGPTLLNYPFINLCLLTREILLHR